MQEGERDEAGGPGEGKGGRGPGSSRSWPLSALSFSGPAERDSEGRPEGAPERPSCTSPLLTPIRRARAQPKTPSARFHVKHPANRKDYYGNTDCSL